MSGTAVVFDTREPLPSGAFADVEESMLKHLSTMSYAEVANQHSVTDTNYWPEFGTLQYIELTYIILITILGTMGNLIVIFSIVLEGKVHSTGNIFIINLAVADFMICSITLPTVAANIVAGENVLSPLFCDIIGFLVNTTCTCSLCNLALVALNRYWAVARSASYRKRFSKKIGITMAVLAWVWSILVTSPTVLGWGALTFDAKALVCAWLDTASMSYSIFLICVVVALPMVIIAFSYFRIFSTVRASGKWKRSLTTTNNDRQSRSAQRERSLIYTLLATIICFCVCWTPYAIHVLIDPGNIDPTAKKFLVWLALSNSSINFIIYGILNPAFKKGYRKLFYFVFRCSKDKQQSSGQKRSRCSSPYTGQRSAIVNTRSQANHTQGHPESRNSPGRECTRTLTRDFDMRISETEKRPEETRRRGGFHLRLKMFLVPKLNSPSERPSL